MLKECNEKLLDYSFDFFILPFWPGLFCEETTPTLAVCAGSAMILYCLDVNNNIHAELNIS